MPPSTTPSTRLIATPTRPIDSEMLRGVHQPRPHVAALESVPSRKSDCSAAAPSVDADQVAVRRDEAEQLVLEALREERDRHLHARVERVDPLERERVALADQALDVRDRTRRSRRTR